MKRKLDNDESGKADKQHGSFQAGKVWWYKFAWNSEAIRESTKQSNKRTAEKMEATHRASLAKGEAGIRDRVPVPTLKEFAERDFLPFIRAQLTEKPKTLSYYETGLQKLLGYPKLANAALTAITTEAIPGFVAKQRESSYKIPSINRHLQVL